MLSTGSAEHISVECHTKVIAKCETTAIKKRPQRVNENLK